MGHGSWVTASDLLTHDDKMNCAVACIFSFLVDIKELLTHSSSPIIIAGGLILIYDFLLTRLRGCPVPPCHAPSYCLCGSCGSWVSCSCVMGYMGHGSRKMIHFHLWDVVKAAVSVTVSSNPLRVNLAIDN